MMDVEQTLHDWLDDIDLEEYEEQFNALGIKKVKHLKYVTRDHLIDKLNMLELEIPRFEEKIKETFQAVKEKKVEDAKEVQNVTINMPSPAFGPQKLAIPEEKLIAEYSDLWYEPPAINFKQRVNNEFILQMCSASRWRFATKNEFLRWARDERDIRWKMLLSCADVEQVKGESDYFKEMCVPYMIERLNGKYSKVVKLMSTENAKPSRNDQEAI